MARGRPQKRGFADQSLKIRHFTGYPMAGLTGRAQRNKATTYPVVI
jgi:hypothetical protein